jgi:hypothetical protein
MKRAPSLDLQLAEHPDIVFKDGPAGRRAALRCGPDVWELIKFLREVDEPGPAAINAAAEVMAISEPLVCAGVRYYREYSAEIDAEIVVADRASVDAEQAWLREQELRR